MFKITPRLEQSRVAQLTVPFVAVVLTLLCGTFLFLFLGKSPVAAFYTFFVEPLTTRFGVGEVLLKAGPLLLIAQGLAIGFRSRVWNIGAEGQLIIGAICAGWLAILFDGSESSWLLPSMILAGMFGGMAWAGIAAWLRVYFNANEILVTFMLSSVALQILYYLVTGPLRDPMGFNFPQSIVFGDAALFNILIEDTRVNTSLFMSVVAAIAAYIFMHHSLPGYKLIVSGHAPLAARYAGFAERQAIWLGLLIGGAAAGLAGVGEVAGPIGQLQRSISPGYGICRDYCGIPWGLAPIGNLLRRTFYGLGLRRRRYGFGVSGNSQGCHHRFPGYAAGILSGQLFVCSLSRTVGEKS